jgi:hypothetical protein
MPEPLSADIRSRFRRLYDEGLSGREIGRRLMISAASASRLAFGIAHSTLEFEFEFEFEWRGPGSPERQPLRPRFDP